MADHYSLLDSKRDDILACAVRHGAFDVRVFGSVARAEADDASDIDILVQFEPDRTLMDHAALLIELQQLLGRKVDVINEQGLRPRVRERVLTETLSI